MALYVIGDLHLSLGVDKPMDVFGGRWQNYMQKLTDSLSQLTPDDELVLCGDTSWGMSLTDAQPDFDWLAALPCRTIYLIKGNHDYWWQTANKLYTHWQAKGIDKFKLLHNNAYDLGTVALSGTRGWFYELDEAGESSKIYKRELLRLEASLKAAQAFGQRELLCFLHYPPLITGYRCDEIVELLTRYGVQHCYFGHLHGAACARAIEGEQHGVVYTLTSADHLSFTPIKIAETAKKALQNPS